MRAPLFPVLLLGWVAGCASQSSTKPVEVLDERTGVTLGLLQGPIELVPSAQSALVSHKPTGFAYLGPVEWNRSGTLSYGLWVDVAPGSDAQPGDIRAAAAVTLILDDGPLVLSPIDAPYVGREPYRQVVSWGQTAYFGLTVETLRRMAASRKLALDVRAADGSVIHFLTALDAHTALTEYVQSRGITRD